MCLSFFSCLYEHFRRFKKLKKKKVLSAKRITVSGSANEHFLAKSINSNSNEFDRFQVIMYAAVALWKKASDY